MTELFDKGYEVEHVKTDKPAGDNSLVIHHYKFHDHEGNPYHARIVHYEGDKRADVQFADQNKDMHITGKVGHHVSKVFGAMRKVLDKHTKDELGKPENSHISHYTFDSEKEPQSGTWKKFKEGSRSKLYRKFTEKLGGTSEGGDENKMYTTHNVPVKRDK